MKKAGMSISFPELQPGPRILLGPGPTNINPRVIKAMISPIVGHLDPDFTAVMENIKRLLRIVFQTTNEITFPVSGTGSSGMEAALMNLVDDGDEVVVAVAGAFGSVLLTPPDASAHRFAGSKPSGDESSSRSA
jgi:alanine-glyoxylate transaminase/serine-glyoxylate transaminase/serine-pyruvate transaminase